MITLSHVSKHFRGGVTALNDVDLTLGSGMIGLVGSNGAGKTTLMRLLVGLQQPSEGNVEVLGHQMRSRGARMAARAGIGYLPQDLGLYPDLSAIEFLEYVALLKGQRDQAARRRQVAELLELVRLTDVAGRKLKTYSGGMKQRVGIAQALLGQPQLLIVDEPTTGLDPDERVRIRTLLSSVAERCTVILSTHIIEDISLSCHEMVVLHAGSLIYHGTPAALIGAASGAVWEVTSPTGAAPAVGRVAASQQLEGGVRHRVLSSERPTPDAHSIQPSLEDAYLWLMMRREAQTL